MSLFDNAMLVKDQIILIEEINVLANRKIIIIAIHTITNNHIKIQK